MQFKEIPSIPTFKKCIENSFKHVGLHCFSVLSETEGNIFKGFLLPNNFTSARVEAVYELESEAIKLWIEIQIQRRLWRSENGLFLYR